MPPQRARNFSHYSTVVVRPQKRTKIAGRTAIVNKMFRDPYVSLS